MGQSMVIRVCAKCDKAFYSSKQIGLVRCTYCGFVLTDGRSAKRIHREIDFVLTVKDSHIKALLKDFSAGGLRALYNGNALDVNTEIYVELEPLNIQCRARTVWSKRLSTALSESGFKFMKTPVHRYPGGFLK